MLSWHGGQHELLTARQVCSCLRGTSRVICCHICTVFWFETSTPVWFELVSLETAQIDGEASLALSIVDDVKWKTLQDPISVESVSLLFEGKYKDFQVI